MKYPYTPVLHAPALCTIEVNGREVKVNWMDAAKYQKYLSPEDMGMDDVMNGLKRFFRCVLHWEENKMKRKWVAIKILKTVKERNPELYHFLTE
ncbi:MAG: hypothetical protein IJ220_05820 [Clostridia bacterium]|nr:hypothetical protein [Clostridia bacterium]